MSPSKAALKPGDRVIFRAVKRSAHPGPRAKGVAPEPMGEDYSYEVDKLWIVAEIQDDGQLLLRTRRGKTHVIKPDHPRLRRPNWWEKIIYAKRFPILP